MTKLAISDGHNLGSITDGQRDCLRLVMLHMSSKEIARNLGISPHTVDQRLRVAVRNLGVTTRFEAARMLAMHAEAEAEETYQSLIYQAPGLGTAPANQHDFDRVDAGGCQPVEAEASLELNASQASFRTYIPARPVSQFRLLPPIWGDGANDLSASQRVQIVLMIALGSLLAFGMFLSGLDALSRLI